MLSVAKGHTPRRGSMAFYPRKRARSIVARVRSWGSSDQTGLLGFAGYKVGMLHVIRVEDNPNSPFYGQEVSTAATVIETPPLLIVGVRAYEDTPYGLRTLGEVWAEKLPEDLSRVFTVPKKEGYHRDQLAALESLRDAIDEVRVIVATQPRLAGIHKKKPEVFEIKVGGGPGEALDYSLKTLGKEISVNDVFKEGSYVDVISVTKGKGFQGVIKRYGVKEMPRWHKHRKGSRRIGSVGPTKPAIMFTTPFPGQLGFHQRTEYNKRILKIGDVKEDDINPAGGWPHYGLVRSMYVMLEGSIPGPAKRLVKLRVPVRPRRESRESPRIVYVSTKPIGE